HMLLCSQKGEFDEDDAIGHCNAMNIGNHVPSVIVKVLLNGYPVNAMLDTGSDFCDISSGLCSRLRQEFVRENRLFSQLIGRAQCIGYVVLKTQIGVVTSQVKFYVVRMENELLIIDGVSMV